MADHSKIEWTDATWNPITGCSVVSAGCKHCYAMRLAGTRLQHHPSRLGLTRPTGAGPVWTGDVRFNRGWLAQPLDWTRPRRIFVCAHGDLFHENVPDDWLDEVFAVMALAPQHTFQILTKRADRMLGYLHRFTRPDNPVVQQLVAWQDGSGPDCGRRQNLGALRQAAVRAQAPLPNAQIGVSVEDQAAADERIPLLLEAPAAVRWVSAEPLLGPVNLGHLNEDREVNEIDALRPWSWAQEVDAWRGTSDTWEEDFEDWHGRSVTQASGPVHAGIDWVVAGGESGPGARPMHPQWVMALRDQCASAGVPFHFKQWGAWVPMMGHAEGLRVAGEKFVHRDGTVMGHVGKRVAGRLLEGVLHDAHPAAAGAAPGAGARDRVPLVSGCEG